ncbi:MAG: hypothetical protein AB1483_08965 [Candidatus Zixiibacteriota bacterium]
MAIFVSLLCFGCGKNPESNAKSVTIHYIDWNILTEVSLSCEDVALFERVGEAVLSGEDEVKRFVSLVSGERLEPKPGFDGVDARICCILMGKDGATLSTVALSPTGLMEVDGTVYKTDTELFEFILSYLPDGYIDSDTTAKEHD